MVHNLTYKERFSTARIPPTQSVGLASKVLTNSISALPFVVRRRLCPANLRGRKFALRPSAWLFLGKPPRLVTMKA
jgi:hypothetical protein